MVCEKLRNGYSVQCGENAKRYYQQVVLINRSDVLQYLIKTAGETPEGNYVCNHSVIFQLQSGAKGYRYSGIETGSEIFGYWEKSSVEGNPQYTHIVNILMKGVQESEKCLMRQLDKSDYFAAVQFKDGTVEIYGFEYGLTTSNYSYNPHNNSGGGVISLRSLNESLEDEPPFVYGGDPLDFDNDFEDVVYNPDGDFNDDFNDDFNNQDNND